MTKKYRKKQLAVVDAFRWPGSNPNCVLEDDVVQPIKFTERTEKTVVCASCGCYIYHHGLIDPHEKGYRVCPGDWIVKDDKGEYWVYTSDEFEKTYEIV